MTPESSTTPPAVVPDLKADAAYIAAYKKWRKAVKNITK